tara:strand:- start:1007 stop:1414 length:408 start_codon:yes stop_codon:yes gene_type:complete
MKRFRVRFHLGKGKNYKMWQVKDRGVQRTPSWVNTEYYNPEKCNIKMYKCKLGNQESTARKIFEGDNKTVCAWVDCDNIDIEYRKDPKFREVEEHVLTHYKYNPKKNPHWFTEEDINCDGKTFLILTTSKRKIYG